MCYLTQTVVIIGTILRPLVRLPVKRNYVYIVYFTVRRTKGRNTIQQAIFSFVLSRFVLKFVVVVEAQIVLKTRELSHIMECVHLLSEL